MRHILVTMLVLFGVASLALAEVPAQSVNLASSLKQGDISRYTAKVQVAGKAILPGTTEPTPIDVAFDLTILHTVGTVSKDGTTQLDISSEGVSALMAGQKIELSKDFFPKLTVLIDKNGDIIQLVSSDPMGIKLPGLNYRNLILLFRTYAPATALTVGSTWQKLATLAPEPEKYDLKYTLQAFEDVNGVKTAKIRTDFGVQSPAIPAGAAKGFALTNFSIDGGTLIKSHAEMTIKVPGKDPSSDANTTIKVDIAKVSSKPAK